MVEITQEELMAELEKCREDTRLHHWTKEQDEFLLAARENEHPLSYPLIQQLWKKRGWRVVPTTTLASHLEKLRTEKNGRG